MVAVSQAEWAAPVKLVSAQSVADCVKNKQSLPGNAVVASTQEEITLLKSLWSAFQISVGLTLIGTGSVRREIDQLLHTRMQLTRKYQKPRIEDVGLLALGQGGPWICAPQTVSTTRITKVQRSCVRISAPESYRKLFSKASDQDSVKAVLRDIAVSAGVQMPADAGKRNAPLNREPSS